MKPCRKVYANCACWDQSTHAQTGQCMRNFLFKFYRHTGHVHFAFKTLPEPITARANCTWCDQTVHLRTDQLMRRSYLVTHEAAYTWIPFIQCKLTLFFFFFFFFCFFVFDKFPWNSMHLCQYWLSSKTVSSCALWQWLKTEKNEVWYVTFKMKRGMEKQI